MNGRQRLGQLGQWVRNGLGTGTVRRLVCISLFILLVVVAWKVSLQWVRIDGFSMEPGLEEGDFVLVNKLAYGVRMPNGRRVGWRLPRRGTVAVFRAEEKGTLYIKRIIGLPGDTIAWKGGFLILNGASVSREREALDSNCPSRGDGATFRESLPGSQALYRVRQNLPANENPEFLRSWHPIPPQELFVLGDNRDHSTDSRTDFRVTWQELIGRAVLAFQHDCRTNRWRFRRIP